MAMAEDTRTDGRVLEVEDIKKLLPHRPPFLFVDRLIDICPGESAVGIKGVTVSEPYFVGHFPEFAVMPGVILVEAMAQTAGAVVVDSLRRTEPPLVYFMTIDRARFRHPVRPGDLLRIPVRTLRRRGPVWRFAGAAYVGQKLCAEAEFSAMIRDDVSDGGDGGNTSDRDR